jgi:hypothetical protein
MVVASIRVKIVKKTTEILYRGSKQSGRDFKRATLPLNPSVRLHKKNGNIRFQENPSNGSGVFPCGRTDGPTYQS